MVEVQRSMKDPIIKARILRRRRFYYMGLILRSTYLIPAGEVRPNVFYINPYVDWDQYIFIYDRDFKEKDIESV